MFRLSYEKDATTGLFKILEESNYYSFGMKHSGYNSNNIQPNYKYKYNGKELQDELGLNVYDYQNRTYAPATGRWLQMDPLAEKGRRWSPYTYAMDNPIYFIDPDGMWPDNPFSGIIDRAKSAVVKYVANKVSHVVSVAKSYVHQKSKEISNAITPSISNPFTTAKADKPDRTSSNGMAVILFKLKPMQEMEQQQAQQ